MIDTQNLYKKIIKDFKSNDYISVIKDFKKYSYEENTFIDEHILYMYSTSLIKLGLNYEAIKSLKILNQIDNSKKNKFNLATTYYKVGDYEKALNLFYELLKEEPNSNNIHYHIAKIYTLCGEYKKAKKILFEKYLYTSDNLNIDIHKLMSKIDRHLIYNSFIEKDYNIFKNENNELNNGYVVTLKDHSKYIENDNEYGMNNRKPYLIWINEKNIYGFLINSVNTHDITENNIGNIFIKIDEKDIGIVIDKVKEENYKEILENIYKKIFYYGGNNEKNKYSPFIQGMKNNLNVSQGDVIAFKENNKYNYYLILKANNNNTFRAIEITTNDELIFNIKKNNLKPITLKKDKHMFKEIKIDSMEKRKLYKQIPECYTTNTLEGKIIRKDNQEIIVLLKNENEYIGIDRIYSNSFMNINTFNENEYVDIIDTLEKDEYLSILNLLYEKNLENNNLKKIKIKLIEDKIEKEEQDS